MHMQRFQHGDGIGIGRMRCRLRIGFFFFFFLALIPDWVHFAIYLGADLFARCEMRPLQLVAVSSPVYDELFIVIFTFKGNYFYKFITSNAIHLGCHYIRPSDDVKLVYLNQQLD